MPFDRLAHYRFGTGIIGAFPLVNPFIRLLGNVFSSKQITGLLLFSFVSTAIVAFLTPMHSDDYGNAWVPFTFGNIAGKYFEWSGRLVADVFSVLTASLPLLVKSILTGFVLTVLIYTISTISPVRDGDIRVRFLPKVFLLVFVSYWLFHSALGESTFWFVGSANYLWPLASAALFIKFTLFFVELRGRSFFLIALLFAFPAGCSNEGTCIGVLCVLAIILFLHLGKKEIRMHLAALAALCGSGAAVLLLAPGNKARMITDGAQWLSLSWAEKLGGFYPKRILDMLLTFKFISLLLLVLLTIIILKKNNNRFWNWGNLFLFTAFVVASALALGSPWIAKRSLSSVFFFMLCSLSSYFWILLQGPLSRSITSFVRSLLIVLVCLFTVQYSLIVRAYYFCTIQDQIRISIIDEAKKVGNAQVVLPDFYFTMLLRKHDMFDRFLGYGGGMAAYKGMEDITFVPKMTFNYALVKLAKDRFLPISPERGQHDTPELMYMIDPGNLLKKNTFVIGFPENMAAWNSHIALTLEYNDTQTSSLTLTNGVGYQGKVYFGSDSLKRSDTPRAIEVILDGQPFFQGTFPGASS